MSSKRAIEPSKALVELGSRLSRDTLVYTVGTALTLPVSLLTTAFMTRHFPASEFGQLAVLFASAGLLTVVLNMIFLQGALLLVFVHADVGVALDWETADLADRRERPLILTTGLCITAAIGAFTVLLIWLFSAQIAQLLLQHRSGATSVTLAAISAATGAVWRFVTNITRMERRPSTYASAAAARPLIAITLTVPLVLLGEGINGALIATAAGSVISCIGALWISRRSYARAVSGDAAWRALKVGLPWIPVVTGLFVAHSADLLFLRSTSSNATLGTYRIADGLASIISYAVSAFHLAQVPLEGTLTVQSAYAEHTRDRVMATYVLSYFMTALGITLLLSLGGGPLVSLIAPGYGKAVPYIPLTSMAYVGYGFLLVAFRAGDYYENRVRAYGLTAVAAGISVAALALSLLHVIGVAGAPIGAMLGCFGTAGALLAMGHVKHRALPLDYRRLFGALAWAGVCWAIGTQVGHGPTAIIAKLCALAGYPLGLVAMRIIPQDSAHQLPRMLQAMLPRRRGPSAVIRGVAELPPSQRDPLIAVGRDRLSAATAALRLGIDEATLLRSVACGLRALAGGSGEFPMDEELAVYLLSDDPPADQDEMLREARGRGADMLEFRAMERAYQQLRATPRRAWNNALLSLYEPSQLDATGSGETLEALSNAGWEVGLAASAVGMADEELRGRAIGELRLLAGCGQPGPEDQLIAKFLLDPESVPPAAQLWAAHVDPIELHRIDLALCAARDRPPAARPRQRPGSWQLRRGVVPRRRAVPELVSPRLPLTAATYTETAPPPDVI